MGRSRRIDVSDDEGPAIEGEIEWLYHGTSSRHLPSILAEGLRGGTCWGTIEMAEHFARVECKGSGGRPKVVARRLSAFDPADLEPDEQAVDFPMTDLFGSTYDVLGCEWEESAQGWEDCLRLYRSVVCVVPVAVTPDHVLGKGAVTPSREPGEPAATPSP